MCSEMTPYSGNGNGGYPPEWFRNKVSFLSTSVCTQYVVSGRVRGRFSLPFGQYLYNSITCIMLGGGGGQDRVVSGVFQKLSRLSLMAGPRLNIKHTRVGRRRDRSYSSLRRNVCSVLGRRKAEVNIFKTEGNKEEKRKEEVIRRTQQGEGGRRSSKEEKGGRKGEEKTTVEGA